VLRRWVHVRVKLDSQQLVRVRLLSQSQIQR
jgi:hypothetical protein